MPFNDYYAQTILGLMLAQGTGKLEGHESVYIGLCTNIPTSGNFSELSGSAYSRILISKKGSTYPDVMGAIENREVKNVKQINWVKATADWPTVYGFGLFTTETGGSPFFYGELKVPIHVDAGDVALFDPEELRISFPDEDKEI